MFLAPAVALACGPDGDCDCDHERHAGKAKVDAKKVDAQKVEAKDDAAKPADAVSAKCNCSGPSDCTCKKGECKCKKCSKDGHRHQGALVPKLKGAKGTSEVPASAPLDASSGLFI